VGVTFTTVCTRCRVDAPEVGAFGYVGTPSLETKRTKKHTQPFGYLYAGLAALGLQTEEIEAFHAFLQEHRGHPMHQWSDAGGEGFEDDGDQQDDLTPAPTRTRKFVFKKGKFVEAFHELACEACIDVHRGGSSASLRPFTPRTLTQQDAKLFQTNCRDLESNTYRVIGFPFDEVDAIARFLRRHAGHTLVVRLDERGGSEQPKPLRTPAPVPPSWTPPEWAPRDHEEALGRTKNAQALAALRRLRHRDPALRTQALATLRELADSATFGHVAMMWRDPEPGVRAAAASVIGALDDPRKARVLGHALLDEAEAVRFAAEDALRTSKIEPTRAAAIAATPRAPDTRPELKKHPDDLKALRDAQLDPNSWWRNRAVEQLAKHKEKEAVDALLEALADPDTSVRQKAVESLAAHAQRDPRVVPALVEAVSDYAAWVVESAVEAVAKLKVKEAVRPIREQLLASAVDYSGKMEALQQIGGPEAAAALGDAVSHASAAVRGHALYTLSSFGAAQAAPHLVKALADPDETVRSGAAHALAELRSGEAVAPLVAGYRSPSKWQRLAVVAALGKIGGPAVVRVLVAALRDRFHDVREAAAAGLVKQKDARGNRALVSAAKRGDHDVGGEAWQYLVGQGEPGTEEALRGALRDRDDATKAAGCFLQCGNPKLAKLARSWLEGRRPPKDAPKLKWGSRRVAK